MRQSQRKEVFLDNTEKVDKTEGIISKENPIFKDHKKKIILSRGISKEEYDEVYMFIRDENKMSSGNYTLLPKSEIDRFSKFNLCAVLMRSEFDQSLLGTILSVPFPIRCKYSQEEKIIQHGCTTFLNVKTKLRGFGMCMLLIKDLISYGYEREIYCSYQTTSFKLKDKALQISSWYRPINLINSVKLGFVFPGFNEISKFNEHRQKYTNKIPKGYSVKRVVKKNLEKALNFYLETTKDKKFVFSPDLTFFDNWTDYFPTFLVYFEKKIIGIFSINTIYCRMMDIVDGQLCLPLLFASKNGTTEKVLQGLFSVAADRSYDAVYMHSLGDLNEKVLKEVHAVKTKEDTWFSLYNNEINLNIYDIYAPVF
jgi:hypothetical protein